MLVDLIMVIVGLFLMAFSRRMNESVSESATTPFEKKLLYIGRGRGSLFFWGSLVFVAGIFNLISQLI